MKLVARRIARIHGRLPDRVGLMAALAWLTGLVLSLPCDATAQQGSVLSVEETRQLVRARYFEGMPVDEAERIGPEGCEQLKAMLLDDDERASHGQVLMAIGICGPDGGLEAIEAWADRPRRGEIDRATFRAWQALPFALGRLARHDARAVDRLERRLNRSEAPEWTFRHHRGARLVSLSRRAAASSLAETDLPEAAMALDRARVMTTDEGFRGHLEEARSTHRRRAEARDRGDEMRSLGGTQGGRR